MRIATRRMCGTEAGAAFAGAIHIDRIAIATRNMRAAVISLTPC
jgi:hypothetical protein